MYIRVHTYLLFVVHVLQAELVLVVQHQLVHGILEPLHLLGLYLDVRLGHEDLLHVFHRVSFSRLA